MLVYRAFAVRSLRLKSFLSAANYCSTKKDGPVTSDSSGSSSSDEDEPRQLDHKAANKSNEASLKLIELLQLMTTEEPQKQLFKRDALNLAKPKQRRRDKKEVNETPAVFKDLGSTMVEAARQVASTVGGDEKQIENELLEKVSSQMKEKEQAMAEETRKTIAAQMTAETTAASKKSYIDLSELIKGMKIEQESAGAKVSRAQQVRQTLADQAYPDKRGASVSAAMLRSRPDKRQQNEQPQRAGLNEGVPFGIFSPAKLQETSLSQPLSTWDYLSRADLDLAITHPPANMFEEMMLWTNQGKLWTFPMDNEIGLNQEANVSFAEHVFLEEHIADWCPQKGPIRHFMELVCIGLSKNPYITVQDKKKHLKWYEEYFTSKQKLLQDVGVV